MPHNYGKLADIEQLVEFGVDIVKDRKAQNLYHVLEKQTKSPVPAEDRARELVRQFADSAFSNRELLVNLIERVELTQDKQVIIRSRFQQTEENST